jgi:hypothetical protein
MAVKAHNGGELFWALTVLIWVVALIVCGIAAIIGRRSITLGILAGVVIGLICIISSCTAILPANLAA